MIQSINAYNAVDFILGPNSGNEDIRCFQPEEISALAKVLQMYIDDGNYDSILNGYLIGYNAIVQFLYDSFRIDRSAYQNLKSLTADYDRPMKGGENDG